MKNVKKLLIVILSVVLVLSCAIIALSACDTDTTYTVTVKDYNTSQGTVTVSKPASGTKYQKDESVTVTVTPATGFEVASFAVSGHSDAALTDGQYTFAVSDNTTISVAFKKVAPGTRYSVTAYFDSSKGSVTLSAPADNGDKYLAGESVTVTVTPGADYVVKAFSVGGRNATLTNGTYTFIVNGNTNIFVEFRLATTPVMSNELLATLQGSVLFDGQFVEHDFNDNFDYVMDYSTMFDSKHNAVWIQTWYHSAPIFNVVYFDIDGKVALLQHNEEGKLVPDVSNDDFAEFDNPFLLLTPNDFEYDEDKEAWVIYDKDKAASTTLAITNYYDNVESFWLYEVDGAIARIEIVNGRITNDATDIQQRYTFDVTTGSKAEMPDEWFLDEYPLTPAHAELKQALEKAHNAMGYTVHVYHHEEGEPDQSYDMLVTPQGIYENNVGWENGYIERVDGNVWWFSHDPETNEFDFENQPVKGATSIYDLYAWFIFEDSWDDLNLSYSMLESLGDGVFELRFIDNYVYDGYTIFAGAMAALFGSGTDQPQYYITALDFRLTIKNGELYQVAFNYDCYGFITEYVELTFEFDDELQFPIEVTEQAFNGTFTNEYIGSWMDEKGKTGVIITLDNLTINGSVISDVTATSNGYSLTWEGRPYTLSYNSVENVLVLTNAYSSQTILYSSNCKWTEYVGIYEGVDKGVTYTVLITEDGIVALIDGVGYVSDVMGFYTYIDYQYFVFYANGVEFGFAEDEDGKMNLYSDETLGIDVYLDRLTSADSQWFDYIGLFEATKNGVEYSIAISATKVYVTIGGTTTQATNIQFDSQEGLTFRLGKVLYCIGNNSGYSGGIDSIGFYPEANIRDYVELTRAVGNGEVLFSYDYTGEWVSEDGEYTMTITFNSLYINGEQVKDVSYLGGNYYIVNWNGLEYFLTLYKGELHFSCGEADIYIILAKGSGDDPTNSQWKEYVGTYTGEDDSGVSYTIVITADDVQITIGEDTVTLEITDYDEFEGFTLLIDGEEYYLYDIASDGTYSRLVFMKAEGYATLCYLVRNV